VGRKNVFFDAGCGPRVMKWVLENFELDSIVLSHTHADHFSSLRVAKGVPVFVPEKCRESVRSLDTLSRRFVKDEAARQEWLEMVKNLFDLEGFEPDGVFGEGEVFRTGEHELVAVATPGHTLDHFAFYEQRSRLMFSFDIDLTSFGPWYGHEESSIGDFLESIRKIRELRPAGLVSSHREPVLGGWEDELSRYEQYIYDRDREVERLVRKGFTLDEMVERSVIYGGYPHVPALLMYFEREMLLKHAERVGTSGELKA